MRLSTNIVLARLFSAPYHHIRGLMSDYTKVRDDTVNTIEDRNEIHRYVNMDMLINRIYEYIEYHEDRVQNITATTLRRILNEWVNERRLMGDISEEDIAITTTDILRFINKVHNDVEYSMTTHDPLNSIHMYMNAYNNRLFNVISGRDPESTEPQNLYILDDPYIKLLAMMRWIQDSDSSDLLSNTGITVNNLVSDFDSLEVNKEMREDLRAILRE